MVNEHDKAVRREMMNEILQHLRLITVYHDEQGGVYRYPIIAGNIEFVTKKLNGETPGPASRL